MQFLFSETCQKLLSLRKGFPAGPQTLSLNRMSVMPRVLVKLDSGNSFVTGNPFDVIGDSQWNYSDSLTESRWGLVNDALGLWMVDNHAAALQAWKGLVAEFPADTLDRAARAVWEKKVQKDRYFHAPEVSGTEGEYAQHWTDDSFRNAIMAKWVWGNVPGITRLFFPSLFAKQGNKPTIAQISLPEILTGTIDTE